MTTTRTTYTVRFHGPPPRVWIAVLGTLLAVCIGLWLLIDKGLPAIGFDGQIGPGCDWGNPNCSKADYRHNCLDLNPSRLRYRTYCQRVKP